MLKKTNKPHKKASTAYSSVIILGKAGYLDCHFCSLSPIFCFISLLQP